MRIMKILPIIGLSLFAYIIYKIGIRNIAGSFVGMNYSYLVIAFLFILPVLLLQTYKWFVILKKQKIRISFRESLKIQIISIFYGFVTPARIGSFIKIAYLQEKTHNLGKSASSVVIDRVLDLLTVLALAGLGSLFLIEKFSKLLVYITIIFGLFVLLTVIFLGRGRSRIILRFVYNNLLPEKMKARAKKSFNSFYDSIPGCRFMLIPILLNILSWIAVYSQSFFIAKSLGINIQIHILIATLAIATLVSLIPISIAGLGTREISLVTLLGFFNIESAKVVTMSLAGLIVNNLILALLGFWFSLKNNAGKVSLEIK